MKLVDVAGALIIKDDKLLIAQRREDDTFALLWEFPGGTVKEGETREDCIRREIKEELAVDILVKSFINTFSDERGALRITVYLYLCEIKDGKVEAKACRDFRWVHLSELARFPLASVDQKIARWLKGDMSWQKLK